METESNASCINILAVVDTEYVKSVYPSPSQDLDNPTAIRPLGLYTLCSGARDVVYHHGVAELEFAASHGDTLVFRGVSIYNNSDDAIIVYNVKSRRIGRVFNRYQPVVVTRDGAVQPDPDSADGGIPPVHTRINFSSLNSTVKTTKKEALAVSFALYTLADDGHAQQLFGYYSYVWHLGVTVLD